MRLDSSSIKAFTVLTLFWIWWVIRTLAHIAWNIGPWLVRVVGVIILLLTIAFFLIDTKRDVSYRYADLNSPACKAQRNNVTALAAADVNNDETSPKLNDEVKSNSAFTCMLQLHALKPLPGDGPGNPSLSYYLSFLEFAENGEPAQNGADRQPLKSAQLDVLLNHLQQQRQAGKQNFVFAFIHGWREDARLGADDVANVRVMAAYLASFLQQRCLASGRYCNATVTAVYIGWRGARLNENYLPPTLGSYVAALTLFDRKPVSERIAPSVISALKRIDRTLDRKQVTGSAWYDEPRLITIGHSLGGNMLAFGLKETMVDMVEHYPDFGAADNSKSLLTSPFGDLIVLLNPASEAENWTAIQRAFHRRISDDVKLKAVQSAYSTRQPPIYISMTASHYWPANDVQRTDIPVLDAAIWADPKKLAKKKSRDHDNNNICTSIRIFDAEYRPYYDYDTATYDLFPFYKWDFRPLAQTIAEKADPDPFDCNDATFPTRPKVSPRPNVFLRVFYRLLADTLRNFPFMNTDITQTRTIGNLDPVRSPYGDLYNEDNPETDPATWYGTTHELLINFENLTANNETAYQAIQARYADAASTDTSECAVVDGWLSAARSSRGVPGPAHLPVNWDSGYSNNSTDLIQIRPRPNDPEFNIGGQIRQTLFFSGMRDIAGANDPFWNMRAFQSAMTSHDGYVSYPLMCVMFQFVMDKITTDPVLSAPMAPPASGVDKK